jgi:hypothetical protein
MGKQAAHRRWWENLKLDKTTAKLVAERDTDSPAELAGVIRAIPDDFRRVFGPEVRADLARAVTAHLADSKTDEGGFGALSEALEEAAGTRTAKPANQSNVGYGFAMTAGPNPTVPPVPPLPKLGPAGGRSESK